MSETLQTGAECPSATTAPGSHPSAPLPNPAIVAPDIKVLGICRFSMIGRGDWKAYRNQPDDKLGAIYDEKARALFAPDRMAQRLATFEHLTLRSVAGQSDGDFTFLVLSSDRLPEPWRSRLAALCATVPQVDLRFVPPVHVNDYLPHHADATGAPLDDTFQFRLDDDDCLCRDFVRRARHHAREMWQNPRFAISFASHFYCVTDGPTRGVYSWFNPFLGAGLGIRHAKRTVFGFAHYRIPQKLVSVTVPDYPNIVTHFGNNDTPRHSAKILKKRGMKKARPDAVRRAAERHFDFLTAEGLSLCGFDRLLANRGAR